MRIIDSGNKRDYYDCMMSMDTDRETLFLRKENEVDLTTKNIVFTPYDSGEKYFNTTWNWPFPNIWIGLSHVWESAIVVGFCGKIYPAVKIRYMGDGPSTEAICYSAKEVDDFLFNCVSKHAWDQYVGSGTRKESRSWYRKNCDKNKVAKFFARCAEKQKDYEHLFSSQYPVFVAENSNGPCGSNNHVRKIAYNAILKDVEFQRVFNAAQAYQEILMFQNNQAIPIKPIPELDDETMAEAKGFDRKFSFRKDPIRSKK